MASKEDCIRAATRAGATPDEARAIVDRMYKDKQAMRQQGHAGNAERELARVVREQAADERLQKALERKAWRGHADQHLRP